MRTKLFCCPHCHEEFDNETRRAQHTRRSLCRIGKFEAPSAARGFTKAKRAVERAGENLRSDVVIHCARQHYVEHIPHRVVDDIRQSTISRENDIIDSVVEQAGEVVGHRAARTVGLLARVGFDAMWAGTETPYLRDKNAEAIVHL